MEDLLLPFRRGNKEKEEKKKKLKEKIGSKISVVHKAKSKIRQADLEFEKAFAEVMGVAPKKEEKVEKEKKSKPKEPKEVKIVGKKAKAKKWAVFYFWYTDKKASSLAEFKKAIKTISDESLNHHAIHNDFSKYLRKFLNKKIAAKVEELENLYKSDELREKLLKAL